MDEFTADTFANRDEPLPRLTVSYDDVDTDSDDVSTSKRSRIRRTLSKTRLQEKAKELHAITSDKSTASATSKPGLQDRLFNKLLEQVVPLGDYGDDAEQTTKIDPRSSQFVSRPAFSLGVMSNNFRRFNARIGIVFVFQNHLIRLFTWRTTTHTLAFLATYTFVCLDPYLLTALPLAVALLFIMVPAFMARHPPPPPPQASATKSNQFTAYSYSGPPIAPARTIRPAAETSKDFFRNMRDLQNCMADFADAHDALVSNVAPATNFSDEILSSTLFLYMFLTTCILFISAHLLPFRAIFLLGGYGATISGHPAVQVWLVKQQKRAHKTAAQYSDTLHPPSTKSAQPAVTGTPAFYGLPIPNNPTTRAIQRTITTMSEITLSTSPDTAEVEVFELQHRPLLPPGSSSLYNPRTKTNTAEWTPHLFTPNPFDPLSPARISGSRPRGTRFFEDVHPPPGWTWHSPKWELDLEAGEWVNDRLIVGVEYDVLQGDGGTDTISQGEKDEFMRRASVNADFGGWVWDLPPSASTASGLARDDEVWLAYGDYNVGDLDSKAEKDRKRDLKKLKAERESGGQKDWEEQIKFGGRGRTGEWRRRRWVRVVKRKQIYSHD